MGRGREKKGISAEQKSSKKLIQLCWKLFPAHSIFLIVYRHTRTPTRGIFPSAKIWTISKSDHHQREIQQPSGSKEKQREIILRPNPRATSEGSLQRQPHTNTCPVSRTLLIKAKQSRIPVQLLSLLPESFTRHLEHLFPASLEALWRNVWLYQYSPDSFTLTHSAGNRALTPSPLRTQALRLASRARNHNSGLWQHWERPGEKEIPQERRRQHAAGTSVRLG